MDEEYLQTIVQGNASQICQVKLPAAGACDEDFRVIVGQLGKVICLNVRFRPAFRAIDVHPHPVSAASQGISRAHPGCGSATNAFTIKGEPVVGQVAIRAIDSDRMLRG